MANTSEGNGGDAGSSPVLTTNFNKTLTFRIRNCTKDIVDLLCNKNERYESLVM